jgi:hypothetical protein
MEVKDFEECEEILEEGGVWKAKRRIK